MARLLRAVRHKFAERNTPQDGLLWLPHALFEAGFVAMATSVSLVEGTAISEHIGGPQPQWKVVLAYLDARAGPNNTNTAVIRNAVDAVDKALMRPRPSNWRVPYMASL